MTLKAAYFVGLALVAYLPIMTGPANADPDCYCTDRTGARVEMGVSICLTVGDRSYMARCEMSQNVPMWRPTGEGCEATSGLSPLPQFMPMPSPVLERLHPAAHLGGVHAHIALAEDEV